jgi:uncharacterized protein (TIGR03083 family)
MRKELNASLAALAAEVADLGRLLAALPDAAWERPTRLPGWDVLTLVAHLARGVGRIAAYGRTPLAVAPEHDRVSYWRYDVAATSADVSARARAAARGATPAGLRAALAAAVADAEATIARLAPDAVVPSVMGPIALVEYVPTRVVEACVHGLDLRAACGAPLRPTSGALAITIATLEALLGGPRPTDLADNVAFVEAATGRRPHPDPRLPLLG